jgi:hypothetical protein
MFEYACESGHWKTPALWAQQKRSRMKELSQSIIKSTKSLLGRLTTVTTMGCMLALVFLVAASPQPQSSGKARPFKATGIPTLVADESGLGGSFEIVGTATHLGKFVFPGRYDIIGVEGSLVYFHITGTYTAANGDTIEIDCPDWVADYGVTPVPSTGMVNIIGGTGRFAHASGSYVGALFPGDAPTFFTAEGIISY